MSKTFRIPRVNYGEKAGPKDRGMPPDIDITLGEDDQWGQVDEGDRISFIQDTHPQIMLEVKIHEHEIEIIIPEDGDLD